MLGDTLGEYLVWVNLKTFKKQIVLHVLSVLGTYDKSNGLFHVDQPLLLISIIFKHNFTEKNCKL